MLSVLAVDDQYIDRYILQKELSDEFSLTTVSSTAKAIQFAQSNSFDIVLLNVMIHEDLDCIGLLSHLQRISISKFLPIAISCHVDEMRYKKIMSAGFVHILKKPFSLVVFNQLIEINMPQHKLTTNKKSMDNALQSLLPFVN